MEHHLPSAASRSVTARLCASKPSRAAMCATVGPSTAKPSSLSVCTQRHAPVSQTPAQLRSVALLVMDQATQGSHVRHARCLHAKPDVCRQMSGFVQVSDSATAGPSADLSPPGRHLIPQWSRRLRTLLLQGLQEASPNTNPYTMHPFADVCSHRGRQRRP